MTLPSSLFVTYSVDNSPRLQFVHGSQHIEATQQKIIPHQIELPDPQKKRPYYSLIND
jgi:hypothetical protein